MTPEYEKEIRKWILKADHSAPGEIDGCVEPQAPISVRQAEFLLDEIDLLRAKNAKLEKALQIVSQNYICFIDDEDRGIIDDALSTQEAKP